MEAQRHGGYSPGTALLTLDWVRDKADLSKICAAELLAEVGAVERDNPAHLVQARAHAFPDTVAEGFAASRSLGGRDRCGDSCRGLIVEIRGDDRGPIVVIARVQDQADGVPDPLCGLNRSKFIEDEYVGLKHRPKHIQFRGLDG